MLLIDFIVLTSFIVYAEAQDVFGAATAMHSIGFCNRPNFGGHCDNVLVNLAGCYNIPDASANTPHISFFVSGIIGMTPCGVRAET